MKCIIALAALTLAAFVNQAAASIPSFGLQTAAAIRSGLQDSDFRINPSKGQIIKNEKFVVQIANVADFPALGGQDVQSQVARVLVRAGQPFLPHYHPRGTETLNALAGVFRVSFLFEGLNPRNVTNILRPGDSTVFPQGLPHATTCISKTDCLFLSVFNTADPGLVPVNL
ncbi:Spherulin-1B [Gracilariopsis chorda]|uniref:Spherulin-1B n=1 Tax=Gracilariopsis chorda TaxID=448386 RepID=A0A2V3IWG7_9FLOR|nr:Spherulin-1B [Gracilariopsis chorda]PXF46456.1 Spherulin-1B [Gracilariopsis chorda]|eukprot:PXF46451.1 Spherulin-1B [Gracilariopsis chorda]